MVQTTENRVKIGAKVNESVYAEFKQHVYEKTGQKRGVLGEAVEAALRQYMEDTKDGVDGDVSNADLLREIRALRSSDATPAPRPTPEESSSKGTSAESGGSASDSAASAESDATPAPPPRDDKGTLADDDGDDDSEDEGKPPVSAAIGERVSWLASTVDIEGRVSFSTLVDEVGRQYPQHDRSKCRELAWEWAGRRAPTRSEYPDESEFQGENRLGEMDRDSKLQSRARAEGRPVLHMYPRRHDGTGAWFIISEKRSDAALNHQAPTQRGDVDVYLGAGGATECAADLGLLKPGVAPGHDEELGVVPPESSDESGDSSESSESSDESGESGEVSAADFDDVDIEGATDRSGEADDSSDGESGEISMEDLDDVGEADRGRE